MQTELLYDIYLKHQNISTDSRKLEPGCIFFALKGSNFNGNLFAVFSLGQGAAYAVVDEDIAGLNEELETCIIRVADVLASLQQLAAYHRRQLKIPLVGITGSNGKTTSKELLASVLGQKFRVFATQGNLNNHIGVPLSILSIRPEVEIAIIEMGANHQKEIEGLCKICQPGLGFITNVGLAHLEGFGGFEGVKKGKKELYDWLAHVRGLAFVHAGSHDLLEMSCALESRIFYGSDPRFTVCGSLEETEGSEERYLHFTWKDARSSNPSTSRRVATRLTGSYNLENVLAAVAVGLHFGLDAAAIANGIELYDPTNNRSQITQSEHNLLFLDFYNANPTSMQASIRHFLRLKEGKKMLILGDMFELGAESLSEHIKILDLVQDFTAEVTTKLIGENFLAASGERHFPGQVFRTTADAADFLKANPPQNYSVLVKGSRGMHLEKLIAFL